MKIWQTAVGHTVEDLLAYSSSREVDFKPSVKINLVGGVIVHSEPRTYPDINFPVQGPWKVAIGVHPKHCDTLTVERSLVLKQLLQHPKVVALGECGLDRTVPASRWSRQDEVFKRMLNLARADQPLILHLRGTQGDTYGVDVHARCLQLIRKICDRNQLIHVHCFKGTVEMVEDWLVEFPRSYFGVTAAVQSFDDSEIATGDAKCCKTSIYVLQGVSSKVSTYLGVGPTPPQVRGVTGGSQVKDVCPAQAIIYYCGVYTRVSTVVGIRLGTVTLATRDFLQYVDYPWPP
ncbi:hypothetical protein FSP39_011426 [Pinctada imbricata]|uniref:Uncharacterized protein n=1 Tax=Pinctada imbricata TaxID=66713 RepID=A0AA88Y889_PINIB|nr:hypothetical protein FSP39_011426 [Pinctada imbricata]